MATVVDAFIVSLSLDPKNFTEGQKKAAESTIKFRKGVEDENKKMGESMQAVGRELLGLFAIFTAGKGIEEFVRDVITADAAIGRMAVNLDTTTQELAALRGMATLTGGSADGITASVMGMSRAFQIAQLTGTNTIIPFLNLLRQRNPDLDYNDVGKGKFLKYMMDSAKAVEGLDKARGGALLAGAGWDQNSINIMLMGTKAVQAMAKEQIRLGVVTEADTAAGIKLQHSIMATEQASNSMGRTLLTTWAPALVWIYDKLTDLAVWMREHPPLMEAAFVGLSLAAAVLGGVMTYALGTFLGLTAPIWGIVAAIVALTAVGGLLFDDWSTWMSGGKSEFGWFYQSVSTGVKDLINELAALGQIKRDIFAGNWSKVGDDYEKYKEAVKVSHQGEINFFKKAVSPDGSGKGGYADGLSAGWNYRAPSGKPGAALPQEAAAAAEKKYGVPAAVTLAQYKLESGNGAHIPAGSNNPFGIKAVGNQPFVTAMTPEFENGKWVRKPQNFRKFDSLADAFDAHAKLLATSPAYAKARATTNANDYADALTGVYATDPNYGAKLKSIMRLQNGGTLGSVQIAQGAPAAAIAAAGGNNSSSTTSSQTDVHTVNVYTQATDGPGVAAALKPELERGNFSAQANSGPA